MSERKVSRTVVVRNPQGLHLRPWGQFAKLAETFDAQVLVTNGSTQADARSPMQLLMLAAVEGAELQLEAQGPAAEQAVNSLCEFIESVYEDIETTEQNSSG